MIDNKVVITNKTTGAEIVKKLDFFQASVIGKAAGLTGSGAAYVLRSGNCINTEDFLYEPLMKGKK